MRIIQRFKSKGMNDYQSYTLLYRFFQLLRYKVVVNNGNPFVQFYFPLFTRLKSAADAIIAGDADLRDINGERVEPGPKTQYFVKAFFSPFDISGNNMHLITALLPGYHPTPEFYLLSDPGIKNMKQKDKVRHYFFQEVEISSPEYSESLVFFHSAGEPQLFVERCDLSSKPFGIQNYFDKQSLIPDFVA
jgi:hypothetical protein